MDNKKVAKELLKLAKNINSNEDDVVLDTDNVEKRDNTKKIINEEIINALEGDLLDALYGFTRHNRFKRIIRKFKKVNPNRIIEMSEIFEPDIEQAINDVVELMKNNY